MFVAFSFVPWTQIFDESAVPALTWLGHNALLSDSEIFKVGLLYSVLYVVSYVGLFFFVSWARWLQLFLVLSSGFAILLYGLSVQSALQSAFGYFLTVGDAALLIMSFGSELKSEYRGVRQGG